MSRINVHSRAVITGFTLAEMMIGLTVGLFIGAGALSSYLFLGRNLTRLANIQQQQVTSRHVLRTFTQDVSAGVSITTASNTQLVFIKQKSSSTATVITTVTYTYTPCAAGANTGTLTRTEVTTTMPPTSTTTTLVSNLTTATGGFAYYDETGSSTSTLQLIKSVDLNFTTSLGSTGTGTLTNYSMASPRVLLRNKPLLQ